MNTNYFWGIWAYKAPPTLICSWSRVIVKCAIRGICHIFITAKDTKNNVTWLCRIAPINPIIEMMRRKTPQAMIPLITWSVVITATAFAYAAIPTSTTPTTWKREEQSHRESSSLTSEILKNIGSLVFFFLHSCNDLIAITSRNKGFNLSAAH